ncbi:LysR family transcriptional regulator [Yaniella flava]|uniref:LysR family transcriptional regulator n=1 Tax=Yaniella flava TaxID=287930 RepID=A0ABP5GGS6_9MICC
MDWEELHTNLPSLMTFLTVARLGRFTAAADSLGINHATVSRRINGLEKVTGQRLLLRSQSGWEITAEGRQVFEIAEEIEQSLAKLVSDDTSNAVTGTVRIGAPEAFTGHIAVPVLARVQREHPGLDVELFTSTQRARQNRSGLDLEIVVGKPEVPRAWERPLVEYQLKLYATQSYLDQHGRPATLQELGQHRLNYYVEAILLVQDLDAALTKLPQMRPGLASTNVYAHLTATLESAGIGLLPDFVADAHPDLVNVLSEEFAHPATYWAVVRQESLRNPAVATVYQALRDYADGGVSVQPGHSPTVR